jgi:hypothetical protein
MGATSRAPVTQKHLAVIPAFHTICHEPLHRGSPPENTRSTLVFGRVENRSLWIWRWRPHDEGT